jgi:DnaK suppressor protein
MTKSSCTRSTINQLRQKELDYFRSLVERSIDETEYEITRLKALLKDDSNPSATDSAYALHMADAGTDSNDRERLFMLIEHQTKMLKRLHAAMDRIDNKTYGICLLTGKRIGMDRLETIPYIEICVESAKDSARYKSAL